MLNACVWTRQNWILIRTNADHTNLIFVVIILVPNRQQSLVMNPFVYLNRQYLKAEDAKISIFDRGLLFGDAVYEVTGVIDGKLIDFQAHMARLSRSLKELSIPMPIENDDILQAYRSLVYKNKIKEGLVYMQITRGQGERDFVWRNGMKPNIFMFTQHKSVSEETLVSNGVTLKSVPDIRWARRDIKSVNLLGQVLAKYQAKEAGGYEALMVDPESYVTECGSTSFFVIKKNTIFTRPLSNEILPGVARNVVLQLCANHQVALQERQLILSQVLEADEAFITGAATYVLPVTKIDDRVIGNGIPGAITTKLRQIYIDHARANAV